MRYRMICFKNQEYIYVYLFILPLSPPPKGDTF
jgi:hypothetical protein